MAKQTLLVMVNDILSDLDAQAVTAITDTTEAGQVAKILQSTYFAMIAEAGKPEHKELFRLTETDASSPSVMTVPTNVIRLDWVMMDIRTDEAATTPRNYEAIDWVEPEEFIIRTSARDDTLTTIDILSDATYTGSTEVMIRNDRAPDYYTSFDDDNLIFDSYDSDIDTFLLASKSLAYGVTEPTWTESDSFTPDLDADAFPLLLSEAKARSFAALKQQQNTKEEQLTKRLRTVRQSTSYRAKNLKRQTDFGRISPRQSGTQTLRSR